MHGHRICTPTVYMVSCITRSGCQLGSLCRSWKKHHAYLSLGCYNERHAYSLPCLSMLVLHQYRYRAISIEHTHHHVPCQAQHLSELLRGKGSQLTAYSVLLRMCVQAWRQCQGKSKRMNMQTWITSMHTGAYNDAHLAS